MRCRSVYYRNFNLFRVIGLRNITPILVLVNHYAVFLLLVVVYQSLFHCQCVVKLGLIAWIKHCLRCAIWYVCWELKLSGRSYLWRRIANMRYSISIRRIYRRLTKRPAYYYRRTKKRWAHADRLFKAVVCRDWIAMKMQPANQSFKASTPSFRWTSYWANRWKTA